MMSSNSRIWLYQADRALNEKELIHLKQQLEQFTQNWVSHNNALKAESEILYNRFVLLKVDESQAGASGCSIDSSVHFVQQLGMEMGIDFFDRMNFAYWDNSEIKTAHKDDFIALYNNGKINDETIVFNNLVKDTQELETKWQIPLHQSWHKNFV